MNIQKSIAVMLCFCSLSAAAQEAWDIDRCMAYAVEHNRTVKQRKLEADNYRLDKMKAIGQFLPGVSGSVSAQYSYGRSVDPATNTYVSQSNFNNGYGMEGSMTVFRGGSLINQVRQSRANELLGKAALQEARDNTALETFQAYIDALYYFGTTRLAEKKLLESDSLVYKTKRQEMLGHPPAQPLRNGNAHPETDDELSRRRHPRARHPPDRHARYRTSAAEQRASQRCVPPRPPLQSHPAAKRNAKESRADGTQNLVGLALPQHQHLRRHLLLLL